MNGACGGFAGSAVEVVGARRPVNGTVTGARRIVVVPSPTCPCPLSPQHATPASRVSTHVSPNPALIDVFPPGSPRTWTGRLLCVVVPFPSRPSQLAPQH